MVQRFCTNFIESHFATRNHLTFVYGRLMTELLITETALKSFEKVIHMRFKVSFKPSIDGLESRGISS